ncbi:MAG TPA: Glu/Leu/Phe/Val dehydrogenase dimerization domain-containing protein [Ktedonobacterales bacterium]|nr:Glu/Leu/Phe/Val dehydrogenase dimerization domain-containing protein [Ktedonobacterales bacterium]
MIEFDRPTGAWIIIAIHSTRRGPAGGGTRMKTYPTMEAALADALELARGMSYKFATADMTRGGGKAVIAVPPGLSSQARADLLRRYGALIAQLGGMFMTGPDVGTSSADMDIIAETGAPYVFGRTPAAGGAGDSGPATALGVLHAMRVVSEWLFDTPSLIGRRVLVQGAGSVGGRLLHLLRASNAEMLFSDVDEAAIRHFRDELQIPFVPAEDVYGTPCDIFAPCALGGILNQETIPRLRCRAVVGSANNQLARPTDAELLHEQQILYAPDFVVNVGGAMAIVGMETMGWSEAEANAHVIESIERTLRQTLDLAAAQHINTANAARSVAEARLR